MESLISVNNNSLILYSAVIVLVNPSRGPVLIMSGTNIGDIDFPALCSP